MNIKRRLFSALFPIFLIAPLILLATSARAEVVVLVHGMLSDSSAWEKQGIVDLLHQYGGWELAGWAEPLPEDADDEPENVWQMPDAQPQPVRRLYLAELPSLAPLTVQAGYLEAFLESIAQNNPEEPIILVGHSAGGVVARMVTVGDAIPEISTLITIASPHLGSPYAHRALELANLDFPWNLMLRFFAQDKYRTLRRARPMIRDLLLEQPGSVLHFLNRQEHPNIAYYAILHMPPKGSTTLSNDNRNLVSDWSQNLRNVAALRDKPVTVIPVTSGHFLSWRDGALLLIVLEQIMQQSERDKMR